MECKYMKDKRKITIKLLEAEQMNVYKVLVSFFAQKFNEKNLKKDLTK